MSKMVRKEAFYPHRPEDVWVALTDPRALAEWLMPNNFAPVKGHRFKFQYDPTPGAGAGINECEVLEIDAPRRMVWSWVVVPKPPKPKPEPTIVSWTLHPEKGGTRLVLEHDRLENLVWYHRIMMSMGWGTMVKSWILKVLGNVKDGQFTPGAIPLEKRCYKVKTIPDDLVR